MRVEDKKVQGLAGAVLFFSCYTFFVSANKSRAMKRGVEIVEKIRKSHFPGNGGIIAGGVDGGLRGGLKR